MSNFRENFEKVYSNIKNKAQKLIQHTVQAIHSIIDNKKMINEDEREYAPYYRAINSKLPTVFKYLGICLISMLVIFIVWASIFHLETFVNANAKVETYSKVRTITSSVPVYIKEIKVEEGDIVKAGQVLITFDADALKARLFESNNQYYFNLGNMAANLALINEEDFKTPADVKKFSTKTATEVLRSYLTQKAYYDDSIKILNEQIKQANLDFTKLSAQKEYFDRSLVIAEEQYNMLQGLFKEDLVSKLQMLNSKQALVDFQMKKDGIEKEITKSQSKIVELENRKVQFISHFKNDVQKEYNRMLSQNAALSAEIEGYKDQLERTEIIAPIDGIVYRIPNTTLDSSIPQGQEIVSIVPMNDNLIITAEITPEQIGFISSGQHASVKINSFDFSLYGALDAEVISISPETFVEQQTNRSYFKVKVMTKKNYLINGDVKHYIIPGMSATVDIYLESRTVMQYLLNPFFKVASKSLNEV
jgi:membrane fusion protein, adhesin transport system